MISRALRATLTLKGVSASAAACCSDQLATDSSAAFMTGGEIYNGLVPTLRLERFLGCCESKCVMVQKYGSHSI